MLFNILGIHNYSKLILKVEVNVAWKAINYNLDKYLKEVVFMIGK